MGSIQKTTTNQNTDAISNLSLESQKQVCTHPLLAGSVPDEEFVKFMSTRHSFGHKRCPEKRVNPLHYQTSTETHVKPQEDPKNSGPLGSSNERCATINKVASILCNPAGLSNQKECVGWKNGSKSLSLVPRTYMAAHSRL